VVDTVFRRRKKEYVDRSTAHAFDTEIISVEKATMQREIDDLRQKLRLATEGTGNLTDRQSSSTAVPSDLASPSPVSTKSRKLGDISVSGAILDELYKQYVEISNLILSTDSLGFSSPTILFSPFLIQN
jgi:hypothetical protein